MFVFVYRVYSKQFENVFFSHVNYSYIIMSM